MARDRHDLRARDRIGVGTPSAARARRGARVRSRASGGAFACRRDGGRHGRRHCDRRNRLRRADRRGARRTRNGLPFPPRSPRPRPGRQAAPCSATPVSRPCALRPISCSSAPAIATGAPFAILVSGGGYASVVGPMDWDPGRSGAVLANDPGCVEGSVAVGADDGVRRESHPLACRNAAYDASH